MLTSLRLLLRTFRLLPALVISTCLLCLLVYVLKATQIHDQITSCISPIPNNDSATPALPSTVDTVDLNTQESSMHCVDLLKEKLAKSPLTEPVKDLINLFFSTLTPSTIKRMAQTTLGTRKILIETVEQLKSTIATTDCANLKSNVTIGLCTVFNGVHHNIQEWMLHYLFLGVQRIVIYDTSVPGSNASVNLLADTKPFIDAGFVSLIPRYRSAEENIDDIQMKSFKDCYLHTLADHTFVAAFDADEFLVLNKTTCLNSYMEAFQNFGGLRVPWRSFTPVGVSQHDQTRSFMSQYKHAIKKEKIIHIKTIGAVKYFQDNPNQHCITSVTGRDQVDSSFTAGSGPWIDESVNLYADIELRHYYGPDWAMFLSEKVCGQGQGRTQWIEARADTLISFLSMHDNLVELESNKGKAYALDALFVVEE